MKGSRSMIRYLWGALALISTFLTNATAQTVFTEAGGVIVIEAESYSNNTARITDDTNFQWVTNNAVTGFSGTGYVEALPNIGTNLNTTWSTTSPELDYAVNFANALTHYVWIRGYAITNTDDSVHAGINGTTNSAANITLNQYGVWQWTRTNTLNGVATLTVNTTGIQPFSLWMREDGLRVDRIILTTNNNFQTTLGNVFHIPSDIEAGNSGLTMRSPLSGISSNTKVFLYTGNQFQGSGNPGNQLATGSTIFYRNATNTTWTTIPMGFWYQGGASGNNKYYSNSIPANLFNPGDTVQYYFKIPYSDHLPTFLYGNDNTSQSTEIESVAQASPFSYVIAAGLQPSGPYVSYTNVVGVTLFEARVYQNTGHLTLTGPDLAGNALTNTITIEPISAVVNGSSTSGGTVLSSTALSNGVQFTQAFGVTSIVVQVTFPSPNIMHYEVVDWGAQVVTSTSITVPSDSSEHFYGFGEKFDTLDQAGNRVHMLTMDIAGMKGDNSYKAASWFLSTRGYGFHLDSTDESYFDMRSSALDRYVVNNLVGNSNFGGYVTNAVKFNVVYGPALPDVLTRYTGYTGRPALPPKWAFAPWMSSDIWHTGGEVRYTISKYRALGIPGSVFVFDSPWEVSYNDLTWNMTQFGSGGTYEGTNYAGFTSVTDMMTFFRTNGFYTVCWFTPFINTDSSCCGEVSGQNLGQSPNYAEGAASNYFARASANGPPLVVNWWKGTGSPVDFTNPNAKQWFQNQLRSLLAASQSGGYNVIGGFKTDDGETGNGANTYIPTNAVYFDGRTGVEMRNGYCVEYHKSVWNVLGMNGLLFARSGFVGSHAYPGYWAGDNEPNFGDANGLPSVVVAGLSSAMSGFSIWASDVGGYQNSNPSSARTNLFMRWAQFGAFSPLMQMHRQVDTSTLLQFPWGYGADALTNYLFYTKLHTALFPYLYSYALQASTNGLPIMRPLVLMNQADTNTYGSVYNTSHSFLFGNELLVAPVITNTATSRTVYLPQGNWYDYFSNVRYSGGQTITWVNADQHQMPLFVREGAIIPMISTNVQTLADPAYVSNPNITTADNSLQFLVYPTTNSSFTVYDSTSLSCQSNGTVISATLVSVPRPILLRFFAAAPFGVERDGIHLPQFTNTTDFAGASLGWIYDSAGFVNVKFNHAGGSTQISFGPDSIGDGISDSWRATQFGSPTSTNSTSCATCDPDGDGLNNRQEYLAGTSPQDASNFLRVNSFLPIGSDADVAFGTVLGMNYRVEYTSDLVTGVWFVLSNNIPGSGGIIQIVDPGAINQLTRFYRVRLLP
jgi:alpha-D-xyloside xylohydrolase